MVIGYCYSGVDQDKWGAQLFLSFTGYKVRYLNNGTWTDFKKIATETYVDSNAPKKMAYTNKGIMQEIPLEYDKTYFLILTKNYAGYREDNDFYIVSAPEREGVSGIAQKVYGNRTFTITVSNNILKIEPPNSDWSTVVLIKLN